MQVSTISYRCSKMITKAICTFLLWLICDIAIVSSQRNRLHQSCTDRVTGRIGTCTLRNDCPNLFENLPAGQRPTVCGIYLPGMSIFCCIDTYKNPKCELPSDTNIQRDNIADHKCAQYSKEYYSTVTFSQGKKNSKRIYEECKSQETHLIIGGQDTEPHEFPFMAAIGWTGTDPEYKCGGSLISEKFVLTAAHCTYVRGVGNPDKVKLGAHNITSENEENSRVIAIKRIIPHEKYAAPKHYHDVALLELAAPLECFTDYIKPVCLWTSGDHQDKATAVGWGINDTDVTYTKDILQKVRLNFYDVKTKCSKFYPHQNRQLAHGLTGDMICAGNLDGTADTCQGDSGGPLITKKIDQHTCQYYLVGVTSFGKKCALQNSSGIYMRVEAYVDWIEKIVWPVLYGERDMLIFT